VDVFRSLISPKNNPALNEVSITINTLQFAYLYHLLELFVARKPQTLKHLSLLVNGIPKLVEHFLPVNLIEQIFIKNPDIRCLDLGYLYNCRNSPLPYFHYGFYERGYYTPEHERSKTPDVELHAVHQLQDSLIPKFIYLSHLTLSHVRVTSVTLNAIFKVHESTLCVLNLRYITEHCDNLMRNLFSDPHCFLMFFTVDNCINLSESDYVGALKTPHKTCNTVVVIGQSGLSDAGAVSIRKSNPLLNLKQTPY
jgi:hypothetical protein